MKKLGLLSAILICVVKLCDTTATSEHFVCKDELGNCIIMSLGRPDVNRWEVFKRATRSQECGLNDLTAKGPFLVIKSFYDKNYSFICKKNDRRKREASNFRRGHYRGQTQSQYLNIENGSGNQDEGKAEAHSSSEGSRAIVSGRSGMGQAQSQSVYDPSCEECLSGNNMMRPIQNNRPDLDSNNNLGRSPHLTAPVINSENRNYAPYRPKTAYQDHQRTPQMPGVDHQQVVPGWQGSYTNLGTPQGPQTFSTDFQRNQNPSMISGRPGSPTSSGNAKPEYHDLGAVQTPGLVGRPQVPTPDGQGTTGYINQGTKPISGTGGQTGVQGPGQHTTPEYNGQGTVSSPGLGNQPGISTSGGFSIPEYSNTGTVASPGFGLQPGISTPSGHTAPGFKSPDTMPKLGEGSQTGAPTSGGHLVPGYQDQGMVPSPGLEGQPGELNQNRYATQGYPNQGMLPTITRGGQQPPGRLATPGYHSQETVPSLGFRGQPGDLNVGSPATPEYNGQRTVTGPGGHTTPEFQKPGTMPSSVEGVQTGAPTSNGQILPGYDDQGMVSSPGVDGKPSSGGSATSVYENQRNSPSGTGGQPGVQVLDQHATPGYNGQGTVSNPDFGRKPGEPTSGGHLMPGYNGQGTITSPGFSQQAGVPISGGPLMPGYNGQGTQSIPDFGRAPGETTLGGSLMPGYNGRGTITSPGFSQQAGVPISGRPLMPGYNGQGTVSIPEFGRKPGETTSGGSLMPGYNGLGTISSPGFSQQPGVPTSGGPLMPDFTNQDMIPSSGTQAQGGYTRPVYPNLNTISGPDLSGQPRISSPGGPTVAEFQKPGTLPSSADGQTRVPAPGGYTEPGYQNGIINPETQSTNMGTGMAEGFLHQKNNGELHNVGRNYDGNNWVSPEFQKSPAGPASQPHYSPDQQQISPTRGNGQHNGYKPMNGQGSQHLPQNPQLGGNGNNFFNGDNQKQSNQAGTVPQSQRGKDVGNYYDPTGSNEPNNLRFPNTAGALAPDNYHTLPGPYDTNLQNIRGGAVSPQTGTNPNGLPGYNNEYANGNNGDIGAKSQGGDSIRPGQDTRGPGVQNLPDNFYNPSRYPSEQSQIGGVTPNNGAVQNREPASVLGGESIPPGSLLNKDYDDDETQALANIIKASNGTTASASSRGGQNKKTAQTQVSGTYTGAGTFDAQAQISDDSKGAQSHVNGNNLGASSSAQGHGRKSKSQAKVELGSETGALITEAQSDSGHISTNTQVQGSVKGGTADAQAHGPGSTSSQAQIGFTPYKEGDKINENMNSPFFGQGMASSNTGGKTGQSQAQLQGAFKYGISYHGASQAGSSLDKDAVFTDRIPFERLNVFDEKNKYIKVTDDYTSKNPETPSGENRNVAAESTKTYAHPHEEHHKNDQPSEEKRRSFDYTRREPGGDINEKDDVPQEDYDNDNGDDADPDFQYDRDDEQQSPDSLSLKGLEVKQSTGGSTQHIVLPPLQKHDAEITQSTSYGRSIDEKHIYQPGDIVPHSNGYTIPAGFTGMIKSVASKDRTYAVGSRHAPAQAQTVSIKPGDGRIKYSKTIPGKDLRSLQPTRHSDYEKHPFVSYSKSVTGDFDANNNMKKQYSHTYYTKASSCGYFTFTCNIVDNGRRKVCTPKMPTNPDGTPMKC